MNERRKIEDRLRKKEQEIQTFEEQIKAAKIYAQALQDVLKMLPKSTEAAVLRPGSAAAQARAIILEARKPVHINYILESLGRDATREARTSLTSSIAAYVRRGEIFSRTAPNTYGLLELGHDQEGNPGSPEPPSSFGQLPTTSETSDDDEVPF